MGNTFTSTVPKVNYEDIQTAIKHPEVYLIINTLPITEQGCLILRTIPAAKEEPLFNQLIKESKNKDVKIIIYGRNNHDETVHKKYHQLVSIGFSNVFVYPGGLFEWLLLQDIFGEGEDSEFPTTSIVRDLLKFKGPSFLNISLLQY
jgi:rhodanese-related sulfurtransferase